MDKRRIIFAAVLLLMPLNASAQRHIITVDDLCRDLTPHVADADVEYKPGVDAHGRDVAPADIQDTPQIQLPDNTFMAISVTDLQVLGLPNNTKYRPEAFIGEVNVEKDGTVYFNRKRVSEPQLQVLCKNKPKLNKN